MLRAYRHDDKSVAREWKIESLSLADLQQLFGVSRDDPMFGRAPVGEAQAGPLSTTQAPTWPWRSTRTSERPTRPSSAEIPEHSRTGESRSSTGVWPCLVVDRLAI